MTGDVSRASDAPASPDLSRPPSVEAYDRAERAAQVGLSVPVLMAFRPVTFQSVGFPVRVECEEELLRYVDHNFEAEVPGLYAPGAVFDPVGYVNSFTPDEAELIGRLRDIVAEMTAQRFGRRTRPMTNLLVQLGPYRAMDAIAAHYGLKSLNVFEPGPGLAYLGALLALQGHRYTAYDVTQALYLWQSHLLSAVAGADFAEYAHPEYLGDTGAARVGHLPWWTFARRLSGTDQRCDIVYSNSNLGEMSPLSLRHLLKIAREMLSESMVGAFMYFSTGMLAQTTQEGLEAEFARHGFVQAMSSPFVCYLPEGRDPRPLRQAFRDGIPAYNPSDSDERLDANALVATPRAEAPLDVEMTEWFHGWRAPLV